MTSADVVVPRLDRRAAEELADELFGLLAEASPLVSYVDQNFRMTTADGDRFVLKIAHAGEDVDVLDAQNALMLHLCEAGLRVPRVCPTTSGELRAMIPARGAAEETREHCVRLVTYLDGKPLAEEPVHSPDLLEDLGRFLGELDRALEDFEAPALRHEHAWNLPSALIARTHVDALEGERRRRVESGLARFEDDVLTLLADLPQSVIQGDANDYNILVDGQRVTGLIDFGDAVYSARVCELAICLAYAMLEKSDPVGRVQPIVRGYQSALALEERELSLLFDLIRTRLFVSVTMSAHSRRMHPDNEYLNVTEGHAWRLLDRLDALDRDEVRETFLATIREAGP